MRNKRMELKDIIFNNAIAVAIVFIIFIIQNIKIEAADSNESNKHIYAEMVNNHVQDNIIDNFNNELNTDILVSNIHYTNEEYECIWIDGFEIPQYIRCTGYCDYGYTKSGKYTRQGIIAGKEEWLGKTCYIYQVNNDGSCGELIGIYEFLDTGYGINGSLINGTSIDVWFSSEDDVWNWMGTYGDYVYIQIMDAVG